MNPILAELDGLSPSAKQALMAAHQGASDPTQGTQPPSPAMAALRHPAAPAGPEPPTPTIPPISAGPSVPAIGSAKPNVVAPKGTVAGDQAERSRLMTTGSGESQIYNKVTNSGFGQAHPLAGKILGGLGQGAAMIGDAAASSVLPQLTRQIPGTESHHAMLLHSADHAVTNDEGSAEKEAQIQDQQSRVPLIAAQTRAANADADAKENPQPAPKEEHWTVSPEYTGPNGEPVEVEQNSGQMRVAGGNGPSFKRVEKTPKETNPQQQAYDAYIAAGMNPQQAYEKIRERPPVVNPNANNARSDKSYQYNQGELDKLTTPISALVSRMGRLNDTLAQGSPQADALVAPELMTVMAGGQGSGLRINEAEINRVLGGRSHWEDLKAAAQRWSLDPKSANSITSDQRQQIHALVKLVNDKVLAKQKALDEAANGLVDSDDPKEHRRIVQKARQALTAVDEGSGNGAQTPQGASDEVYAKDGKTLIGHVVNGKYVALAGGK